jgi:ABC-type nitrate/sulfonate/bicarbonate transport system permease component
MASVIPAQALPSARRPARRGQPSARELMWLSVAGFAALFGLWWGIAATGWMPKQFLPSPADVASAFAQLTQTPFAGYTLQQHLLSSLGRFALGFGLAAVVGIPLGLLMGWFRWLDDIVTPVFESVRFIAPLAWVPFAALWFGTGIGGPILVIFSGAFPPCVINAHRGARLIEPRLVEAAATLGASTYRTFVDVLVPGALPSIIAGLRISAGLAWQSLVGAELIVVSAGIGYMMVQGQSNLATAIVMSGMIAIGAVGFAIDVALRLVERRVRRRWEAS